MRVMKNHVKYRDTGYFLCGLEDFGENGELKADNLCFQCSCESQTFFYGGKKVLFLERRLAQKKVDTKEPWVK